jgi:hypothetical protein
MLSSCSKPYSSSPWELCALSMTFWFEDVFAQSWEQWEVNMILFQLKWRLFFNPALYRRPHTTASDRTRPLKMRFYVNRDRKRPKRHIIFGIWLEYKVRILLRSWSCNKLLVLNHLPELARGLLFWVPWTDPPCTPLFWHKLLFSCLKQTLGLAPYIYIVRYCELVFLTPMINITKSLVVDRALKMCEPIDYGQISTK